MYQPLASASSMASDQASSRSSIGPIGSGDTSMTRLMTE